MKRENLILYVALPLLAIMTSCTGIREYRRAEGAVWGTVYHITYLSDKDLTDSIVYQMHLIDTSLSPFEKGSLVDRINSGEDPEVDSLFTDVFSLSQKICRLSGGAFDPTLSPLINLWGFGYKGRDTQEPTQEAVDSALQYVGIMDCMITADNHIKKKHPKTEFNFSAVAKGYGVDRIAAMLRRNGCNDYMVEVGGEMALSGNGPLGDKWTIQVDAPVDDATGTTHERLMLLNTTGVGIATSGNYRNYRESNDGKKGHTINTVTGRPVMTPTLSATIVAPDCATADAIATSVMAMETQPAKDMLSKMPGVEALITYTDGKGGYIIYTTEGMQRIVKKF